MKYNPWQKAFVAVIFWGVLPLFAPAGAAEGDGRPQGGTMPVDKPTIVRHMHEHLTMLTRTIGERSVRRPWHLESAAAHIEKQLAACDWGPDSR